MLKHFTIRVYGRVQGTNYRSDARTRAIKLGVTGFVRNKPDGSVYIEAEGSEVNLNNFFKWCRKGPWFAKVEQVELEEGIVQRFVDFTVR